MIVIMLKVMFMLTCTTVAIYQDTDATTSALDTSVMSKSIQNFGELSENTAIKLSSRKCLRFVVLGGSVSCGYSTNKTDPGRPSGKQDSWPAFLQSYLDADLPCVDDGSASTHLVDNLAVYAKSSSHWLDVVSVGLRNRNELGKAISSADIVVVETAVNDIFDLGVGTNEGRIFDTDLRIRRYTELLYFILLSYPNQPSLIWLGASTRTQKKEPWNGTIPRLTDAVHAHLAVTKPHRIPHVSAVDGLGPFQTSETKQWFNFKFRSDFVHLTVTGHQIVAHLMLHVIMEHFRVACRPHKVRLTRKKTPIFVSQSEIDSYLLSNPYHIVTVQNADKVHRLTASPGWRAMEDVRGKPGFISNNTGDIVVFFLSHKEVDKHCLVGMLHIASLKSYEHMGTMSVEIFRADEANGRCMNTATKERLGSQVIDSLWEHHVSEEEVAEVRFDAARAQAHGSCLLIRVEIIDSVPSRLENKIKLLGLVIY